MLTAEAGAGVCLDGSPPALYYVAAKSAYNASGRDVAGRLVRGRRGAERSCRRSEARRTSRRSSAAPRAEFARLGLRNPIHAFHVLLHYCDGACSPATATWARCVCAAAPSWTRSSPPGSDGLPARRARLFGGFSAGGLASAVHADVVRARLRRVRQFGARARASSGRARAPTRRRAAGEADLLQRPTTSTAAAARCIPTVTARRGMALPLASEAIAAVRAPIFVAQRHWTRGSSSTWGRAARAPPAAFAVRRRRGAPPQSHPRHFCRRRAPRRARARGTAPSYLVPATLGRPEARLLEVGDRRRAAPPRAPPLVGGAAGRAAEPAHLPCALRDAPANGSPHCEPSCAKGVRPSGRRLGSSCRRRLEFSLRFRYTCGRLHCTAKSSSARRSSWRWPVACRRPRYPDISTCSSSSAQPPARAAGAVHRRELRAVLRPDRRRRAGRAAHVDVRPAHPFQPAAMNAARRASSRALSTR